jgi:O-antigen/teichoic acid export membrane protein
VQLSKLLYQGVFWRGISLASVFILNLVISRILGAQAFGDLFLLLNFLSLALLVASLSLESALGYYTARQQLSFKTAAYFSVGWSVFATALIVGFMGLVHQPMLGPGYLQLSVLYLTGNLLISFFSALFTARQSYVIPNVLVAVVNFGLCGLLLLETHPAVFITGFFASFFLQGIGMAIAWWLSFKNASSHNSITPSFKTIMRYSLLVFTSNLIFFLVYRVDYWFVNYFIKDDAALGNYIQVSKLVQIFFIIPSILAATVFSYTAAGNQDLMKERIQQLSRIIFIIVLMACAALALTGKWLFPFLFGDSFSGMYIPFLWLMPGIIAIATLYPYTAIYAGTDKVKHNIAWSLLALVIILIGDVLLIPVAGIAGAAAVSSAGYIAYEWYILWQFKKAYRLKLADSFLIKREDYNLVARYFKS